MKTSSRSSAFTLIEVMIAMAIFTVVVAAIYSSWTSIVRGSKVGMEAAANAQRARIALLAIESALLTSQLYTENLHHYNFIADTTDAKFAWLSFAARLPANFPGSGLYGDTLPVRRVTFSVETGEDGVNQLIMTQQPLLLVTNETASAYPITLAYDVSLFALEFWDFQMNDWTTELMTTNEIPKMMRVTVGLGTAKNNQQPQEFSSRIVALPSIAVSGEIQRPTVQGSGAGGPRGGGRPIGGGGRTPP